MVLQLKESQSKFHQSHLAARSCINHGTAQVIKGKLLFLIKSGQVQKCKLLIGSQLIE